MKTYALRTMNIWLFAIALVSALAIATIAQTPDPSQQGRRVAHRTATAPAETAAIAVEERAQTSNTPWWLNTRTLRFDVSENAKRFIFDETPVHPDGAPAYGNEFVTEGYLYPAGTLNGTNGVNADGSPEFPDKVVGRWTCRGWHTGEGAKTVTGPWVVTHQVYDLGAKPGQSMILTDGLELVDLNVPITRAISGGTGQFAVARGEMQQVMIGFNQLNGVNLRVEIKVQNR